MGILWLTLALVVGGWVALAVAAILVIPMTLPALVGMGMLVAVLMAGMVASIIKA